MAETKKSIKGTVTERNIVTSYMAENQAYVRYTFYAQQANKAGYYPIEEIYKETAENELHHAKVFFKMLEGRIVDIEMSPMAGVIGDVAANLAESVREEAEEGYKFYAKAAETADKEGFPEIASHFRAIAEVERRHHNRFKRYLKRVKDGTVWKRSRAITWKCLVCGYEYKGTEPPETCPGCDHPREHYTAMDGIND